MASPLKQQVLTVFRATRIKRKVSVITCWEEIKTMEGFDTWGNVKHRTTQEANTAQAN